MWNLTDLTRQQRGTHENSAVVRKEEAGNKRDIAL